MHTEMCLSRCKLKYFSRSLRVISVNTSPSYRYQFGVRCGWPCRLMVATTAMCDAARYCVISCGFTVDPPDSPEGPGRCHEKVRVVASGEAPHHGISGRCALAPWYAPTCQDASPAPNHG